MVEQVLGKFFTKGPEFKSGWGGFSFDKEKQLLAMNPGQDLNYHTVTHLSDIL